MAGRRDDDLDDEERELLAKHRAERAKQQADDFEIEVGDKDGNYARIPYSKGRNWLRARGIEIDDELEEDPGEGDEGKPAAKGKGQAKEGGNVRAFRAGRRISLDGAPHLRKKT